METRSIPIIALLAALALCVTDFPCADGVARAGSGRVVSQQSEDTVARPAQRKVKADEGGPMDVFADIERGWQQNDVELILKHYGKKKVAISIEGTGPSGGNFSRNQSFYLFKDLFKYTITRKFEFVQFRKPNENGGASFAVAEREYQRNDDGRLFKDKIFVSLHVESDRWVVDEIKSIR